MFKMDQSETLRDKLDALFGSKYLTVKVQMKDNSVIVETSTPIYLELYSESDQELQQIFELFRRELPVIQASGYPKMHQVENEGRIDSLTGEAYIHMRYSNVD